MIEDYLTIRESGRPTCKAVGEDGQTVQFAKLTEAINAQAETIDAQSEMLSV